MAPFGQPVMYKVKRRHLTCSVDSLSYYYDYSGAPDRTVLQNIYSVDIVSWLPNMGQLCCYFHNKHIASQRTAIEYRIISNHVISATPLNWIILVKDLAKWLASAEQIFEHLKCIL